MIWKSESWKYGVPFLRKQVSIRETDCFKFFTTQFLQAQPTLLKVFGLQTGFWLWLIEIGGNLNHNFYFGGKLAFARSLPKLTNPVDITLIFLVLSCYTCTVWKGIISPGVLISRGGGGTCVYNNMNFLFHQSRVSSDYPRLQKTGELSLSLFVDQSEVRRELCLFLDEPQRKIKYQQEQALLIDVYK